MATRNDQKSTVNGVGQNDLPSPRTDAREEIEVIRLQASTSTPLQPGEHRSTYHIYPKGEVHRQIVPTADLSRESFRSQAKRLAAKQKKVGGEVAVEGGPEDIRAGFFLHSPYLAFHAPPKVLYLGADKHATPVVLIHGKAFWRSYKLQLGPSLAKPGVLDPRGVVPWKHNGGDKSYLKRNDKALKGYKVRTWRLWGENGKAYVHEVKANRKAGIGPDPDNFEEATRDEREEKFEPAKADEVVYLRWERPFSRHTRRYRFQYSGLDFHWKGTGSVKKSGMCGCFLRFNHLKLVAKLPSNESGKGTDEEICLAKYTSSVSGKKCGRLEVFDTAIFDLVEHYVRPVREVGMEEQWPVVLARLKTKLLYQLVIATAMCMISSEKEKRKAVGDILQEAGEGGG